MHYPPGALNDVVARLLAQKLTETWGQQVVIDNRGGAGGLVGAEIVARAIPDGYTLLMTNPVSNAINFALRTKTPYKPDDFAPVSLLGWSPIMLITRPCFQHVRDRVAAGEKWMEQVERDCPLPHVEIHLVHGHVFLQRAACAVENHIEASKPRDRRFNGAAHCLILCHAGLDEKRVSAHHANLVLGSSAQFRVEVDDCDSRTFRNKLFCRRFGNARAGARQKPYLAFQFRHVNSPSVRYKDCTHAPSAP